MNKDQDYASDTDESDEDFRPDNLAGESAASEDEEADDCSEDNEEETEEGTGQTKDKLKQNRKTTKKSNKRKKSKAKDESETDDEDLDNGKDLHTAKRATRQTEDPNENGKGKTIEKDELVSDDEDKSRTNALWADFLKDVKPDEGKEAKQNTKQNTNEKPSSSSSSNGKDHNEKTQAVKSQLRAQSSNNTKDGVKKTLVTEIVDFAGEEVRIQREIDASSIKENKAAATQPPKVQPFGRIMPRAGGLKRLPTASGAGGSSAGLGSLLNQIGKKKKISVLEKSQMDWKSFKQDEGIDEQLQTFNKGKDGYLERQDFLQRTDLRQFEIEKNLRQTTRRPH